MRKALTNFINKGFSQLTRKEIFDDFKTKLEEIKKINDIQRRDYEIKKAEKILNEKLTSLKKN